MRYRKKNKKKNDLRNLGLFPSVENISPKNNFSGDFDKKHVTLYEIAMQTAVNAISKSLWIKKLPRECKFEWILESQVLYSLKCGEIKLAINGQSQPYFLCDKKRKSTKWKTRPQKQCENDTDSGNEYIWECLKSSLS